MSQKKKTNPRKSDQPEKNSTGNVPEKKKGSGVKKPYPKWFYAIPFIIIIAFFLLLEGSLRLFGYGKEVPTFTEFPTNYPGYLFFNPEVTSKYFSSTMPSTIFEGFRKEKLPNTIRIFVLGESSAAGWPYHPNAAFSRYVRSGLETLYPDKTIEVINFGISAINTFTIRDILPDLLEQKPDCILIYTGHNEYYGALGVGSTLSMGKSRTLINLMLSLQKYKTVQLLQNFIRWIAGVGHSDEKESNATLMERVVGESSIPYNSSLFKSGISQFEGNMGDILEMCKNAQVPVLISNLASNLKDQKPLVVADAPGYENADVVYQKAQAEYAKGNYAQAKELYSKARDLDALRFRAPSEINQAIRNLAAKYNAVFVDAEGALSAASEHGIIGKSLMTDHLHPNLRGYQLIGKAFLEALQQKNILPRDARQISLPELDQRIAASFPFTKLDSLYVDLRLRVLLGAYPFVPKGEPNSLLDAFMPHDAADSLAMQVVLSHSMVLEEAHYALAEKYEKLGDIDGVERELSALISENPLDERPYKKLTKDLVLRGLPDRALPYLLQMDRHCDSPFSDAAIGSVYLDKKEYGSAIPYLQKAIERDSNEESNWYNLAVAYYYSGKNAEANAAVDKAIQLKPGYSAALELKQLLQEAGGK